MSEYLEQIQELVDYSQAVENNLVKVDLIEAAIKIADSHQDIEKGFELREDLINSLYDCGYPEKLLVAFSWCLAQYDRDPQKYKYFEWMLMWNYKWIVELLPNFSQISRQQINDSFIDMENRYLSLGKSLRAVYEYKLMAAISMGDDDLISQYYQQWQDAPKDSSEDCAGCELDREVHCLLFMKQYKRAIKKAQPIIYGRLRCDVLPHQTLSRLLVPLLILQRLDTAVKYHLQSCHKVSGQNIF